MNKDIIDLHITPSMATKEHAVSQLQNILGISKERTIGIGDGHNDIHLFNAVGFRVAMGNAEDSLKKNADLIIDTVDNNGLAKYLSSMQ